MASAFWTWQHIRNAVDGYAAGIVRLIGESYGVQTLQHAWPEFTITERGVFQPHEPNAELFFSWLFHRWVPARDKGNTLVDESLYGMQPTRAYLARQGMRLDPRLRRYLEACLATSARFYEIGRCRPHTGFSARDVLNGATTEVSEELASTSLRRGEIVFAHLIPMDGFTLLEAISPLSFTPGVKESLSALGAHQDGSEQGSRASREMYFTLVDQSGRGLDPTDSSYSG